MAHSAGRIDSWCCCTASFCAFRFMESFHYARAQYSIEACAGMRNSVNLQPCDLPLCPNSIVWAGGVGRNEKSCEKLRKNDEAARSCEAVRSCEAAKNNAPKLAPQRAKARQTLTHARAISSKNVAPHSAVGSSDCQHAPAPPIVPECARCATDCPCAPPAQPSTETRQISLKRQTAPHPTMWRHSAPNLVK